MKKIVLTIAFLFFCAAAYAGGANNSILSLADMPQPCNSIPSSDTLNGSTGGTNCYTRASDTRPTVVQAAAATTDSSGNWQVTWNKSFGSSTYFVNPQPGYNTAITQPYLCNFDAATQTTTFVKGKCWQTAQNTLGGTLTALLGLVINPTSAAVTIPVRIAARDTTQ